MNNNFQKIGKLNKGKGKLFLVLIIILFLVLCLVYLLIPKSIERCGVFAGGTTECTICKCIGIPFPKCIGKLYDCAHEDCDSFGNCTQEQMDTNWVINKLCRFVADDTKALYECDYKDKIIYVLNFGKEKNINKNLYRISYYDQKGIQINTFWVNDFFISKTNGADNLCTRIRGEQLECPHYQYDCALLTCE